MTDNELDRLLASSAPPTPRTDGTSDDELAAVLAAARSTAAPGPSRRAAARLTIGAGIGVGVLGLGVGAAAAAGVQLDWSPWAETPDTSFTYTLPSGVTCETRLGDVEHLDPEVVATVRDVLAEGDLLERADVDGAIAAMRTEDRQHALDDAGTRLVDAGYGTPYYPDRDQEYREAVSRAVDLVVSEELDDRGVDATGGSWAGEDQCQGLRP